MVGLEDEAEVGAGAEVEARHEGDQGLVKAAVLVAEPVVALVQGPVARPRAKAAVGGEAGAEGARLVAHQSDHAPKGSVVDCGMEVFERL